MTDSDVAVAHARRVLDAAEIRGVRVEISTEAWTLLVRDGTIVLGLARGGAVELSRAEAGVLGQRLQSLAG